MQMMKGRMGVRHIREGEWWHEMGGGAAYT